MMECQPHSEQARQEISTQKQKVISQKIKFYKSRDRDIREAFVKANKDFFKTGIFINEYGIGNMSKADLAFFDGRYSYGFEIKSSVDTINRLKRQLNTYTRFFDFVYVISSENHLDAVTNKIYELRMSNYVGVISVNDDLQFTETVQAKYIGRTNPLYILTNLYKKDLINMCESKSLKNTGSKSFLRSMLTGKYNKQELKQKLYERLTKIYSIKCPHCDSNLVRHSSWSTDRTCSKSMGRYYRCFLCDTKFYQEYAELDEQE